MELIPVRPMWRSLVVGMTSGLVVVLGFVVWRALREHSLGWAAVAFGASMAVCAAIGCGLGFSPPPQNPRTAERAPDDAELGTRKRINWRFVLPGAAFALAGVAKSM